MDNDVAIGIGLRDSDVAAAVYRGGKIEIVPHHGSPNHFGMPAYVAFTGMGTLVGETAKSQLGEDPSRTIFNLLRHIGRKKGPLFPGEVPPHPSVSGEGPFELDSLSGKAYFTHTEILATLISQVKEDIEEYLGFSISAACFTVPAGFGFQERQVIMDAAYISGFKNVQLLSGPAAIALSHAYSHRSSRAQKWVFLNIGAASIDVGLVHLSNGIVETKAISGSTSFGHDSIDHGLTEHFSRLLKRDLGQGIVPFSHAYWLLRRACEEAKQKVVAGQASTKLSISNVFPGKNVETSLDWTTLKRVFQPFLNVVHTCVSDVLPSGPLLDQHSKIYLVHGLADDFYRYIKDAIPGDMPVEGTVAPLRALATGAVLQAAISNRNVPGKQSLSLVDTIPRTLGIQLKDGSEHPWVNIVERTFYRQSQAPVTILGADLPDQAIQIVEVTPAGRKESLTPIQVTVLSLFAGVAQRSSTRVRVEFSVDLARNKIYIQAKHMDELYKTHLSIAGELSDGHIAEASYRLHRMRKKQVEHTEGELARIALEQVYSTAFSLSDSPALWTQERVQKVLAESSQAIEDTKSPDFTICTWLKRALSVMVGHDSEVPKLEAPSNSRPAPEGKRASKEEPNKANSQNGSELIRVVFDILKHENGLSGEHTTSDSMNTSQTLNTDDGSSTPVPSLGEVEPSSSSRSINVTPDILSNPSTSNRATRPVSTQVTVTTGLDAFFPANGEPVRDYADADFESISMYLSNCGSISWSRTPRLYTVLRYLDELDMMQTFLDQRMSDIWFPFSLGSLPNALSPSSRSKFIDLQHIVLSKSLLFEKDELKRHTHFGANDALPFHVVGKLGSGAHGQVDKVVSHISHREYARKLFRKVRGISRQDTSNFINELHVLKRLRHIHCVELVQSYTDPKYFAFLMSPVADCSLWEYYQLANQSSDKRSLLRTFIGCLARALRYVHDEKIRHRDIKPQNILVKGDRVLLSDFGIALDWQNLSRSTTTEDSGKTWPYAAPEVARYEKRNTAADVWSLGCVFLEIVTVLKGKTVENMRDFFNQRSGTYRIYFNIDNIKPWLGQLRHLGSSMDNGPFDMIRDILQEDAADRPTAAAIFELVAQVSISKNLPFCGRCCLDGNDSETEDEDDGELWVDDATVLP